MFFHSFIVPEDRKNRTNHPKPSLKRNQKPIYGKIIFRMKNPNFTRTGTPPKLLPTLLKGFNTIANHWYLILFPVVMDIILWLGPKLRVKTLLTNFSTFLAGLMTKPGAPDVLSATGQTPQAIMSQFLDRLNLASTLRTFPVGIPSLIARESPITSPLGQNKIFEVPSINWVFAILAICLLVGFLLGSLYFLLISRVTAQENDKLSFQEVLKSYGQSLVLFCLMIMLLVLISIPLVLLLSLLTAISLGIAQFFIMVALFILLWLLLPLVFAPHGIFVLKQKALPSMLISVRLVRLFLPGAGLFIITSALISEGLNMLWTLPDPNSWMTLIGIGGHSFIITGLLAASFIYYREGLRWMQENLQRMAEAAKKQQENGGTTLEQQ
jgi:ABC-type multidrug transport system permease subunit